MNIYLFLVKLCQFTTSNRKQQQYDKSSHVRKKLKKCDSDHFIKNALKS